MCFWAWDEQSMERADKTQRHCRFVTHEGQLPRQMTGKSSNIFHGFGDSLDDFKLKDLFYIEKAFLQHLWCQSWFTAVDEKQKQSFKKYSYLLILPPSKIKSLNTQLLCFKVFQILLINRSGSGVGHSQVRWKNPEIIKIDHSSQTGIALFFHKNWIAIFPIFRISQRLSLDFWRLWFVLGLRQGTGHLIHRNRQAVLSTEVNKGYISLRNYLKICYLRHHPYNSSLSFLHFPRALSHNI